MNEIYPSKDQDQKIRISHELYSGTEFDPESESASHKSWQEGGKTCESMQIGHLNVRDEVLQILEDQDWKNYALLDGPEECRDNLTPEAFEYLVEIWAEFNKITAGDMRRSGVDPSSVMWDDKLSVGFYDDAGGMNEPHCDDPSEAAVRYALVVSGSATRFYSGDIPYELFDQEGNLKDNLPASAEEKVYPSLSVVRFTSAGGVHSAPNPDGNVRIFIDTTADLALSDEFED